MDPPSLASDPIQSNIQEAAVPRQIDDDSGETTEGAMNEIENGEGIVEGRGEEEEEEGDGGDGIAGS